MKISSTIKAVLLLIFLFAVGVGVSAAGSSSYTVGNIAVLDIDLQPITQRVEGQSVVVSTQVSKNDGGAVDGTVVIAFYNSQNQMQRIAFGNSEYIEGQAVEVSISTTLPKAPSGVKCFVWEGISSLKPLSNISTLDLSGMPIGGGSGGGGGGAISNELKVKGTVVASYDLFIDDYLREMYPSNMIPRYFYIKPDWTTKYGEYLLLDDPNNRDGTKYKQYIGKKVWVYYDETIEDIKTLKNIQLTGDTISTTIDAKYILSSPENRLYYLENISQMYSGYIDYASNMKIIYNERLLVPSPSQTSSPTYTLNDLIPTDGSVTFIFTQGGSFPDLAIIKSYETWFVGSIEALPNDKYTIYDKYAKDEFGQPRSFTVDGYSKYTTILNGSENGTSLPASNIRSLDVLSVAASKDGVAVKIIDVPNSNVKTCVVKVLQPEFDFDGISFDAYSTIEESYYYRQYFKVQNSDTLELNDALKYYTDYRGKLVAWFKNTPALNYGYLIDIDKQSDACNIKMFTSSINTYACKGFKMKDTISGKYVSTDNITALERLRANAAYVNANKPSQITKGEYSQLIAYEYNGITQQMTIDLLTPETSYTSASQPVRYISGGEDNEISPPSNGEIYSLPNQYNNEKNYMKLSLMSSGMHNIETYKKMSVDYFGNSIEVVGAILLYNEDIDKAPSVYNPNTLIVNSITMMLQNDVVVSALSGYGSSIYSNSGLSGNKIKDNTGASIDVGDLIWYGKIYDNGSTYLGNAKILFDINSDRNTYYDISYNSNNIQAYDDVDIMRFICASAVSSPSSSDNQIELDVTGDGQIDLRNDIPTSNLFLFDKTKSNPTVLSCQKTDIRAGDKIVIIKKRQSVFYTTTTLMYVIRYPE